MMKLSTYTSEDLEAFDCISGFESITEQGRFMYQLTDDEKGWLWWMFTNKTRYALGDVLGNAWSADDDGAWSVDDDGTVTIVIDPGEISSALGEDGIGRAPCLCEDTQLARLIWFIGPDEDYEGNEQ